ncbi:unnamed protein product [marine sediment metagenome]|uniref:PD(D/E)XK endonuclease domain-containing protein n=1 Tax=marine sediment metagenome TaxID=412755 RepID=X0T235_9ZZZZ
MEGDMGKIKEGKGTIIGNAGEYLVVGELLKRGVIAAPAPRNNPGFDVLATNGINSLNIRVKTKTEASDSWVWVCKKDGTIFKNLSDKSDFTVLVDLKDTRASPEYYIILTVELDRELRAIFKRWLESPPKRGIKPHNPNNKMRRIGASEYQKKFLSEGEGNWSRILNALKSTP